MGKLHFFKIRFDYFNYTQIIEFNHSIEIMSIMCNTRISA